MSEPAARTPPTTPEPERDPLWRWRLVGLVATADIMLSAPPHLAVRSLEGRLLHGGQ